jgi:hypothetical protein
MIKSSLEFAPGTSEPTKKLVSGIPPYDLLVAYRNAVKEFGATDIVLLIAIKDGELAAFEAMTRATYVTQAFNKAARGVHPMARESAHRKMSMPADIAAFWLVVELRDKDAVVTCAIGEVRYEVVGDGLSAMA